MSTLSAPAHRVQPPVRKPPPKPIRTIRLCIAPSPINTGVVHIAVGGKGQDYLVNEVEGCAFGRGFLLSKVAQPSQGVHRVKFLTNLYAAFNRLTAEANAMADLFADGNAHLRSGMNVGDAKLLTAATDADPAALPDANGRAHRNGRKAVKA